MQDISKQQLTGQRDAVSPKFSQINLRYKSQNILLQQRNSNINSLQSESDKNVIQKQQLKPIRLKQQGIQIPRNNFRNLNSVNNNRINELQNNFQGYLKNQEETQDQEIEQVKQYRYLNFGDAEAHAANPSPMRHRGSVSDSQENSENLDDEQNEDYLDLQDMAQTAKNQQQDQNIQDQQREQMEDDQEQNNKEIGSGQESIGKNEKKIRQGFNEEQFKNDIEGISPIINPFQPNYYQDNKNELENYEKDKQNVNNNNFIHEANDIQNQNEEKNKIKRFSDLNDMNQQNSIESIENINVEQNIQKQYVNEFLNELESPNQIEQKNQEQLQEAERNIYCLIYSKGKKQQYADEEKARNFAKRVLKLESELSEISANIYTQPQNFKVINQKQQQSQTIFVVKIVNLDLEDFKYLLQFKYTSKNGSSIEFSDNQPSLLKLQSCFNLNSDKNLNEDQDQNQNSSIQKVGNCQENSIQFLNNGINNIRSQNFNSSKQDIGFEQQTSSATQQIKSQLKMQYTGNFVESAEKMDYRIDQQLQFDYNEIQFLQVLNVNKNSSLQQIIQICCGFYNKESFQNKEYAGRIIIGVNNEGVVEGVQNTDQFQEKLESYIIENCSHDFSQNLKIYVKPLLDEKNNQIEDTFIIDIELLRIQNDIVIQCKDSEQQNQYFQLKKNRIYPLLTSQLCQFLNQGRIQINQIQKQIEKLEYQVSNTIFSSPLMKNSSEKSNKYNQYSRNSKLKRHKMGTASTQDPNSSTRKSENQFLNTKQMFEQINQFHENNNDQNNNNTNLAGYQQNYQVKIQSEKIPKRSIRSFTGTDVQRGNIFKEGMQNQNNLLNNNKNCNYNANKQQFNQFRKIQLNKLGLKKNQSINNNNTESENQQQQEQILRNQNSLDFQSSQRLNGNNMGSFLPRNTKQNGSQLYNQKQNQSNNYNNYNEIHNQQEKEETLQKYQNKRSESPEHSNYTKVMQQLKNSSLKQKEKEMEELNQISQQINQNKNSQIQRKNMLQFIENTNSFKNGNISNFNNNININDNGGGIYESNRNQKLLKINQKISSNLEFQQNIEKHENEKMNTQQSQNQSDLNQMRKSTGLNQAIIKGHQNSLNVGSQINNNNFYDNTQRQISGITEENNFNKLRSKTKQ